MFDVSLTELMVIGVVALIVIGPERLPKVARTVGHLLGRAQRYVNDVKSDIQREIELDELRKFKSEMETAAQGVQKSLHETQASLEEPVQQLRAELDEAAREVNGQPAAQAPAADASEALPAPTPAAGSPAAGSPAAGSPAAQPATEPARTIAPPAQNPNLALDLGPEPAQATAPATPAASEPAPAAKPATPRNANVTQDASQQEDGQQESFISHLIELRSRLLRAAAAIVAVFIVLFIYPGASPIYDALAQPMLASLPQGTRMIATGVITPFMVPVKVTMMAAFIIALPVVLYQAWAFVAPGLYRHEKRLALPLIVSSTVLFLAGMAFCYFVVFRTVFHFIATFAPQSITPAPDIEAYLSFVMTMFLAFGITFEVPVAVVLLVKMGVVELSKLKAARGYVVVGAFIIAAVVTPDVVSQFMLAVPLCLLYEVGLICARMVSPRRAAEDDPASDSLTERH